MLTPTPLRFCFWLPLLLTASPVIAAPPSGEVLYLEKCAMCHLPAGQGAPPAFPPLAGSDWLTVDRARTIRVVCEGLEGPIRVNGVVYNNVMPAAVLNDEEAAAVLTYITNTWGNQAAPFTAAEVAEARKKSRFPTFADLQKASAYAPLPTPPSGWTLREAAQLPALCSRLAASKDGTVYALGERGTIYRLENGTAVPWILPTDYADLSLGTLSTMGFAVGPDQRLWLVSNQQVSPPEKDQQNHVTLWRSDPIQGTTAPKLTAWLEIDYPWGVGPFNHGVSHLAFGPDGMLYVSSGSRTDGGEPGETPGISHLGETDLTACLWKLDPNSTKPTIEVVARGLRNAYGFAWHPQGQLFAVVNGPDADAPEEMDAILAGKHYGFPYQYSDWALARKPYEHTPTAPDGLSFTLPVRNNGPAGGGGRLGGLSTFDPHSSPAGMAWCGEDYPEPLRNSFLVTRYGNLLPVPQDAGFDLLKVVVSEDTATGRWQAAVTTVLAPLGRPIDVLPISGGKILILEYTRPTDFKSRIGWLPGRILELAPAAKTGG